MRHLCTVFALTLLLAVVTPFTFADGYYYEAGDVVAGETIKADVAAWLNEIKGHSTKAMFEAQFDNDGLSLEQEYLLNTLPLYNTTVDFRISSFVVSNVVSISVELIRTEDDFLIEDPLNGRLVVQSSDTPDGTLSGVLAFSGTSVTLPLESGDTQKYYRAAIIRDASYIFSAAVPLTNSDGSKFVPTGDQIAGYTVTEFDEDMLRSSIRVEFPCQRNTMVIAVPEDMLDKIAFFESDGSTQLNPYDGLPTTEIDQGMDYTVSINNRNYKVYLWDTKFAGSQSLILKHK